MNTPSLPTAAPSTLSTLVRGLVDEHWVDFAIGHVSPLFSLGRVKARVVSIHRETEDAIRIELAPNRHWAGHRAGQFARVKVLIGGVLHERCYSVLSPASQSTIELAVKRQPGGLVSNHLNDHLKVGDIVELGLADGEFCLPPTPPARLLLVAGGSGITPIHGLAEAALAARPDADVVLAYYARTPHDFILAEKLEALAAKHPNLKLRFFVDRDEPGAGHAVTDFEVGRFSEAHLETHAPDVREREVYVCGPTGLMDAVERTCRGLGIGERFHRESFGPIAAPRLADEPVEVSFARTGIVHNTEKPTLLEAAEEAGLKPAFGCRIGICHTCTCTKVSGVVRDRVTGAIDDAPNRRIRLCVSEPVSAVRIDL